MREYDLKKALSTGSYTRNSIKPQLLVAEDGEYRQGDILDANATMEVVNGTASGIDDKINDILGVDNGAVQELVGILSDSDTTTGILNELAKKANISDLETVAGQVQSDWLEADTTDPAYIKNKPTIPTKLSDLQNDAGFAPISGTVDTNGHNYIEIAGVKWATKNVGALTETDCGLYFLWGDSLGYTADQCGTGEGQRGFGRRTYKFAYSNSNDSMGNPIINYTKYDVGGLTILDPEDDAATVNMGGDWRMPTNSEVTALFDACNIINADGTIIDKETITGTLWETTLNGMKGLYLEDKTDHTKRIFFPTAGYLEDFPPTTPGKSSYYDAYHPIIYWLKERGHNGGSGNDFADSFGVRLSYSRKCMACPVRGVLNETNTLHKVATSGNYNDLNNKPTSVNTRKVDITLDLADQITNIAGIENTNKIEIVIYNNDTQNNYTVSIDSSYKTVDGNQIVLSVPAGCYGEVCYTNIGGTIFAKGIKQLANS